MSVASTSLEALTGQVIDRAIEAAKKSYKNHPLKLAGSINGLEACRGKAPLKLIPIWQYSQKRTAAAFRNESKNYWFWRCRTLEIDWVLNNISCFLYVNDVIFPWKATARGFMNVASILSPEENKW